MFISSFHDSFVLLLQLKDAAFALSNGPVQREVVFYLLVIHLDL